MTSDAHRISSYDNRLVLSSAVNVNLRNSIISFTIKLEKQSNRFLLETNQYLPNATLILKRTKVLISCGRRGY
jgi:hypothetical protein